MSLFKSIIESVFPERPDYRIVQGLSLDDLLLHFNPTEVDGIIHFLPFSAPAVRATLHEAKFHHNEKAWQLLGNVLAVYLKHYPSETILLPIPLSRHRQKHRKYNQVTEIAKKALADSSHIKLSKKILVRLRDTKPQTTLKQKERQLNVEGAFGALDVSTLSAKNLIILDDVTTTGATLKAAKAALNSANSASITLISLAH